MACCPFIYMSSFFFFVAVCHLPFLFVPRLCCHYHQQFNKWLLAENDITLTRYAYSYVWSLQATTGYQLLLHTIQSYCSYAASSHNFTHPTTRQLRFTNMRSRVTVCTVVFLNSIPSLLLATHSHTLRNAARTNKCQMNKKKKRKKRRLSSAAAALLFMHIIENVALPISYLCMYQY